MLYIDHLSRHIRFGTYHIGEQQRLRRVRADVQTRQYKLKFKPLASPDISAWVLVVPPSFMPKSIKFFLFSFVCHPFVCLLVLSYFRYDKVLVKSSLVVYISVTTDQKSFLLYNL